MTPQLKEQIENYLNSFDDDLSYEEIEEKFSQANSLLRDILDDDEGLRSDVSTWQKQVREEGADGNYIYTDGDLVDKAIGIFNRIIPTDTECRE